MTTRSHVSQMGWRDGLRLPGIRRRVIDTWTGHVQYGLRAFSNLVSAVSGATPDSIRHLPLPQIPRIPLATRPFPRVTDPTHVRAHQFIPRSRMVLLAVLVFAGALIATSSGAAAPPHKDKCSNLPGIQRVVPRGYKRAGATRCVRLPKCDSGTVRGSDGYCHVPYSPPPPPQPVVWWPSDYTAWTGAGNAFATSADHTPLTAYQPSTCRTVGGTDVPNGSVDPFGRVCWSYLFQVSVRWSDGKTGCGSLFVSLRETSNGVIVGDTIGSARDVPNNTPVLIRGSVASNGHPNLKVEISSIDCYS